MDTHALGKSGENIARMFLENEGHIILCQNYKVKGCEIDIVSKEKCEETSFGINEYIVFTEVKYRKDNEHGNPYEAVSFGKQKKICRAALHYLMENHYSRDTSVRFDVISIANCGIEWIKNAFEFVY